mgnify:CR=1 FL=1
MISMSNFNPHTREGCDYIEVLDVINALIISIHTPVKGVTTETETIKEVVVVFQSTHP